MRRVASKDGIRNWSEDETGQNWVDFATMFIFNGICKCGMRIHFQRFGEPGRHEGV